MSPPRRCCVLVLLAELKTLRAKGRLPDLRQGNTIYNGRYPVQTFQEVIDLRDRLSRELHHEIGTIAEYEQFFRLGVDGVFSDNPDTAKVARDDQ